MRRFDRLCFLALGCLLAANVTVMNGCSRKQVGLGPKPAGRASQNAFRSEMVDNLRAWVASLSSRDVDTLEKSGRIVFSYEELKRADPAHAQMVDELASGLRIRMEQGYRARGLAFPQSAFRSIKAVSFVKGQRAGEFEFRIECQDGSSAAGKVSEPL